jgi:endo-1,4-beta-xylanase
MRRSRKLLFATLTLIPPALLAQNEPVIIEAESGTRGAAFNSSDQDGVQYISIASTVAGGNPTSDARVATYTVTFPAPGTYELYGRLRVGAATFSDDSFYYANGFGVKPVSADASADGGWILANGLAGTVGFTLPNDKVVGGGLAQSQVWKWVKLSAFDGGETPVGGFAVAAGNLTQTFQIAGREDGLDLDKFAFGPQGVFYTVNNLDTGTAGTTVPPPPPYEPPGPPIATGQPKFLGSAYSAAQATSFTAYWNKVTPENGGKWGSVEPTRDVMNWNDMDAAYAVAKENGFPIHMHVLVWGGQQPTWIETLPAAEQLEEIHEWFAAVAARYPDLDFVEVVNEPLHQRPDQPGSGNYAGALGGTGATGWDWVINAFRMARSYFPNSKLLINDYSITNTPSSTQTYKTIIELLQAENLIDGIGVQGHAFSTTPNIPMSTHLASLDSLATTGLPIYVTEFDVDGPTDEVQLADYQRIFPVFWEHPAVQGITLWGFRPGMWRTPQGAYLVLENGAERPAMKWLQAYVQDAVPVVTPGQVFTVSEHAANATVLGTALATDADPGATLSQWQINSGTGTPVFEIAGPTGSLSVTDAAALDFEATTSYTLFTSVYDGYRRSAIEQITVQVLNENDNAPTIDAAQVLPVDGGYRNIVGTARATDADDRNQPGFTTFQDWSIVGGNGASIFAIDATSGAIRIARPQSIDFRRSQYTLTANVSDGLNASAPQSLTVSIPDKVRMCLLVVDVRVPKKAAPTLLRLGASLGSCRRH